MLVETFFFKFDHYLVSQKVLSFCKGFNMGTICTYSVHRIYRIYTYSVSVIKDMYIFCIYALCSFLHNRFCTTHLLLYTKCSCYAIAKMIQGPLASTARAGPPHDPYVLGGTSAAALPSPPAPPPTDLWQAATGVSGPLAADWPQHPLKPLHWPAADPRPLTPSSPPPLPPVPCRLVT